MIVICSRRSSIARVEIDPTWELRNCPDVQIGVSLPVPLNARLDDLVARAIAAGESTSRKELLAALVFEAPVDGDDLSAAIRRYRKATAMDAVPEGTPPQTILDRPMRRPGPRPRRL